MIKIYFKPWLLLLIICLFGGWLRFKHLHKNLHFLYSDGARDSLVVKHMVDYDAKAPKPNLGFGHDLLNNSPLYYQFLSLVWLVWQSPLGLTYFFASLGTLQILVNYYIGLKIKNKNLGLCLALSTALALTFINSSRSILQAKMMPILTSLIIATGLMSIEKAKVSSVSLYIFFCLIALHFHYSILLLFPILASFGFIFLKKIKRENNLAKVLIPIFLLLFLSWLWIVSTENYNFFPKLISSFINNNSVFSLTNFTSNLNHNLRFLINSVLINLPKAYLFIFFLFGSLSLISIFITKKREQAIFLSLLYFSYILTALFKTNVALYHYQLLPFYTIFFLVSIKSLFDLIPNEFLATFLVLALTMLAVDLRQFKLKPHSTDSYRACNQIANLILQDYKLQQTNLGFVAYVLDNSLKRNWFAASIYYPLEEISGRKLVEVVSLEISENNLHWLNSKGKYIYVTCEYEQKSVQYCHDYVQRLHPQAQFISGESLDLPTMRKLSLLKYEQ